MGGACHDNQQTINILHDEIETVFEDVIWTDEATFS